MGIKKFMTSLNLLYQFVEPVERMRADHLYLDFNSIIHDVTNGLPRQSTEEEICNAIVAKLRWLVDRFDGLQTAFISIDGIPSKAKWFEQRTRQFSSLLERRLRDELERQESGGPAARGAAEEPVGFHKGLIKPYTPFMRLLSKRLNELKHGQVRFVLSSYNRFGEGEFKILQHIRANYEALRSRPVVIFSPDADMIINSILLRMPRLQMVRLLEGEFVMYDIQRLKQRFVQDVRSRLTRRVKLRDHRVFADIMFLFTFLGNDFLPGLLKGGHVTILQLLSAYILYLSEGDAASYILAQDGERYSLDRANLVRFWKIFGRGGRVLFDMPKQTRRAKLQLDQRDQRLYDLMHIGERHFLANRGPFESGRCPTRAEKLRQYVVGLHWLVEYYFNYTLYNSWHYNCLDLRMDDVRVEDIVRALEAFDPADAQFQQGVIDKREYLHYILPRSPEFSLIYAFNGIRLTSYQDDERLRALARKIVTHFRKHNYNPNVGRLADVVCLGFYLNSCIVAPQK